MKNEINSLKNSEMVEKIENERLKNSNINNELDDEIKQIYNYFNQITDIKSKLIQSSQEEKNNLLYESTKESLNNNIWLLECSLEKLKKNSNYENNKHLKSLADKMEKFINFHRVLGSNGEYALEKLKNLKVTSLNINEQLNIQNNLLDTLKEKIQNIQTKVMNSLKKLNNLVVKTSHVSLYVTLGIEAITIICLTLL